MDRRAILQKIIDEDGCCNWAIKFDPTNPNYICQLCPMSKLKKHSDGRYLSCFEALGCNQKPTKENEHEEKYKKAAERMLSDLSIEDMLQ